MNTFLFIFANASSTIFAEYLVARRIIIIEDVQEVGQQFRDNQTVHIATGSEQIFGAQQVPFRDGVLYGPMEPGMQDRRRARRTRSKQVQHDGDHQNRQ